MTDPKDHERRQFWHAGSLVTAGAQLGCSVGGYPVTAGVFGLVFAFAAWRFSVGLKPVDKQRMNRLATLVVMLSCAMVATGLMRA